LDDGVCRTEKIAEATRKFAALQSDLSASEQAADDAADGGQQRRSIMPPTLLRRRLKTAGEVAEPVVYRSMRDVKLALSEFYLSLILLQNYQSLNFTGFRKILKKHDKVRVCYCSRVWSGVAAEVCSVASFTASIVSVPSNDKNNVSNY